MKKSLGAVAAVLMLSMISMNAHALYTHCELTYEAQSLSFGGGVEGVSTAQCWRDSGPAEMISLNLGLLGGSPKGSDCSMSGEVSATGTGFTLEDFLSSLIQTEVSSILISGGRVNFNSKDFNLTVAPMNYSPTCLGLGSIQGLIANPL